MIRTLIFGCCLLLSTSLFGQETVLAGGEGGFLTLGLGIPIHTVRDKVNSPLAYRGTGVNIRLEYERVRENWLGQARLSISTGSLRARLKPRRDVNRPASFSDLRFSLGAYRNLGSVDDDGSLQYGGASVLVNMDDRTYPLPTNNISGMHYRLSGRVGFLDRRGVGNGTRWAATSQIDVPLISRVFRPNYIGLPPLLHQPNAKGGAYWKTTRWRGPGGFLGLEARFALDYRAQDFRSDRLEYTFLLGYTPEPSPKSLLFTAGQLSYAYRARL